MTQPLHLMREKPLSAADVEPFAARRLARQILRTTRNVALASLDRHEGFPYSSITNLSVEPCGGPVIYASRLSHHGQNILADPRISMTLVQDAGRDVLRDRRLTLIGRAHPLTGSAFKTAGARYCRKFPRAGRYIGLPDTLLFLLRIEDVFLNGGPARYVDDLRPDDLTVPLDGADALVADEGALIAHLDRFPEKLRPLQSGVPSGSRGHWQVTTIDPEGIDLGSETEFLRLELPRRARSPSELLSMLGPVPG
ncbi:Pyridoxamine 5'-phosphate oxidase [Pseudooceanicola marinus]|uniref:Pyridoxamine 5'-phosphate oxidase n=1 Tax=Pseudooceanicola marinus TaxID=396013 RepID=A0A1X6ZPC8_9RHOB|nr:pyridoxamine 5'-phosphate oxidase family protein [Pseudooceanicola marinus]PJE26757.1 pyridoxamine 5-phosphate oxidase [Pseudooceanicola marinus]SLN57571.1 Pyridoxamine 5'-phosphate oxidase [Pseudooceanicola marinus]